MHGLVRQTYLTTLQEYQTSDLIKVLIGQRRCGKSTILKQYITHLLQQNISPENILFLNFELHELSWVQVSHKLIDLITTYFNNKQPQGRVFIFLDEIQDIQDWEKTVNSFLANERYDIDFYLTGSNANLLSTELSTHITGRYVEIPILPFSFLEFAAFHNAQPSRATLLQYLETSGIPELFNLHEREQKIAYLTSLKESILMNDVIKRFNIKHPKLLMLLVDFLIDNMSKLFSINGIVKKINAIGIKCNAITVANYVRYIELTFLVHQAKRYDIKGKKILEGQCKYYLNDLGFSNFLQSSFDNNITRRLENFVYTALIAAGYHVTVGTLYHLEIDFIAEKDQKTCYIQVAYLLQDNAVIAREYGNLEKIKDHWPKWVVSMDELQLPAKTGIKHIQAWALHQYL